MKKIGFTGTQLGMTPEQKVTFINILSKLKNFEFHHGDCIGSDSDAHELVKGTIHIHPPNNPSKRAFKDGVMHPEKPYLDRNKDIVDSCDILIATPKNNKEELRSGTWSTIRYAKKTKKNIIILYPNGKFSIW